MNEYLNKTQNYQLKKMNINQFVYLLLSAFSSIVCIWGLINNILLNYYFELDKLLAIVSVVISVYLCWIYRYNIGLFIVMLFMAFSNYSVAIGVYFDTDLRPENLYSQFTSETLSIAILCILIFEIFTLLFTKSSVRNPHLLESRKETYIKYETNDIIAYGAMIVYAIIFFMTFRFGESGTRGGGTALTEYRVIVYIIGSFYSGNKRIMKTLWTILIGVISVLVFVSGNRIDAITAIIALLIFWYGDLLNYKKVILIFPLVSAAMIAIGATRGGSISLELLNQSFVFLGKSKMVWDTSVFAYLPSLSIVEIANEIPLGEKVELLRRYIEYLFMGSAGDGSIELITYSRDYYTHYYGCISPCYFYMWFGYVGAIIFAFLVNLYKKVYQKVPYCNLENFAAKLKYIFSLYFISNVGRWYLYGPNSLLRNMFVCAVVFFIVYLADRLIKRIV